VRQGLEFASGEADVVLGSWKPVSNDSPARCRGRRRSGQHQSDGRCFKGRPRGPAALAVGDPEPLIAGYAKDAVLVFPGLSSWGGTYRGREAIAGFLRRYISDGIVGEIEDILVNGPPWQTRVCIVMTAKATEVDGTVVYDIRAALYAVARWGRIVHQEDFEDTHKSVAFDEHLKGHAN
jgi:ketosteroid isomerase-like protein